MTRKLLALLCGIVAMTFASGVVADEKKRPEETKTLEGKLVCTKCELKETAKCGHCLLVKDVKNKDKDIKYYLKDKGTEEPYHGEVCSEPKPAKVTGKVIETNEKGETRMSIEMPKVEFKK